MRHYYCVNRDQALSNLGKTMYRMMQALKKEFPLDLVISRANIFKLQGNSLYQTQP